MKNLLTGAAIVAAIMIILIAVNVVCNRNGIELDTTGVGVASAIGAMLIYQGMTKKEKGEA